MARHHVLDAEPGECLARGDEAVLGAGRLEQEPADEGEPDAADGAREDEERHTEPDEGVPEAPPDSGGEVGRPREVAAHVPEDGAEHAAAVERERREEVEHEQHQVDRPEPEEDAVDVRRKG
jgi:hypothetical protein